MADPRPPHLHRQLESAGHRGLVRRIVVLFGPYKLSVAIVGLLIVVSAGLGVLSPVPGEGGLRLRSVPCRRFAGPDAPLGAGGGDCRDSGRWRGAEHCPGLAHQQSGPGFHRRPAGGGLRPPAGDVAQLPGPHPHRGDAVPGLPRCQRHRAGGRQHLRRLGVQRRLHHRRRGRHAVPLVAVHSGGHGGAAGVPAAHPLGWAQAPGVDGQCPGFHGAGDRHHRGDAVAARHTAGQAVRPATRRTAPLPPAQR